MLFVAELVAAVFVTKLALQKVFFKKYKRFGLEPKIDKVGWWLPTKMHLILAVVGVAVFVLFFTIFLVSAGVSDFESGMDAIGTLTSTIDRQSRAAALERLGELLGVDRVAALMSFLICVLKAFLILMIADFLLIRHYVRKNATVKGKDSTPDSLVP
jgi:hypothetical protein